MKALKRYGALACLLPVQYMTEAWAEQALLRTESDPRVLDAVAGINLSILTILLHPPKDAYGFLYTRFEGDGLFEYRVGKEYDKVTKGMAEPTFVVSGEYGVFEAIQLGEMSERKALLTGKIHLTGSMLKALRYMRAMETITAVLGEIECERTIAA